MIGTRPDVAVDPARAERHHLGRWIAIGLAAMVLGGALFVGIRWFGREADIRDGTTIVTADALAARYGIDIKMVGVTAAGGLLDFRYQVVDPDKANAVIHDLDLYPVFIVEDTGETIAMRSLPHSHGTNLELGGSYFFLLPNANNAVHPGSSLTIVIGDARLEHVVAQG
jgi:hypothetical protein